MLTCNTAVKHGEMIVADDNGRDMYKVHIVEGNCLAVFIAETDDNKQTLWNFLADRQHGLNIIESHKTLFPFTKVKSIRLNMFYKENKTLLDLMMKSGLEVTCFYKEQ